MGLMGRIIWSFVSKQQDDHIDFSHPIEDTPPPWERARQTLKNISEACFQEPGCENENRAILNLHEQYFCVGRLTR